VFESQNGNGPADEIVAVDDLSVGTLIALVDRLRLTETPNQFLCREVELDEAYLQADVDYRKAEDEETKPETVERAKQIRSHVINAHDFLGESNISAAVEELNRVIEIKIGL
jgi:hypothetical protein